jgi:predicted aspartyl protease
MQSLFRFADVPSGAMLAGVSSLTGSSMVRAIAIGLVLAGTADAQTVAPVAGATAQEQTFAVRLVQGDAWAPLPYEQVKGVILLQAVVLGQPATVLLDNGTDRTIVDTGLAQRAGIELQNSSLGASTGQSRLSVRLAKGATLILPHTLTAQGEMPAIDLTPMSVALGRPIAAVIGGDLLNRVAIMVRPGKRQVAIAASGSITPGARAIVISVENGNQVKAEINGKLVHLKIDFGSSGAIRLTDNAFERVSAGVVSSSGSQTSADGVMRITRMITANFQIGSITAKGAPIESGYAQSGADGLLGNGFLSQADTILDLQKHQLILTSARPAN